MVGADFVCPLSTLGFYFVIPSGPSVCIAMVEQGLVKI